MQKPFYLIIFLIFSLSLREVRSAGLLTQYSSSYVEVYSDRGTGSDMDLSVWKPQTPPGWYNLGYIFTNDRSPPTWGTIIVQENIPGMLAQPIGWQGNWNDAGSGGDVDGSIWTPICPAGYFPVGSVAIHIQNWQQVTNDHFPEMRCVRCSLLEASYLEGVRWNDNGSGADMDITVYTVAKSPFYYAGSPATIVRLADELDKPLIKRWKDGDAAPLQHFAVGDFNGDGKDDFISQEEGNEYANLFLRTRTDDGFRKVLLPKAFDLQADMTKIYTGDFNGDKKDDFIRIKNQEWVGKVFLSKGDGSQFTEVDLPYHFAMNLDYINLFIGDFNGDGKDDLLRQEKDAFAADAVYTAQIFLSVGDGTFTEIGLPEEYKLQDQFASIYVGDFNGDGKDDFFRVEKGSSGNNAGTIFLSLGVSSDSGLAFAQLPFPSEFLHLQDSNTLYIADFNGDGKDDFLRQVDPNYISEVSDQQNTVNVFLSLLTKGSAANLQDDITTYFQSISLSNNLISDLQANEDVAFYIGDFNKDGKDDIIRQPTNLNWDTSIANIFLSSLTADNTLTFMKMPDIPLRGDFTPLYIGDFNGDGKSDLLKQEKGTWGDEKFSLPTIYLALDITNTASNAGEGAPNMPFDKIYYRAELDAKLIKDAEAVKADVVKELEYDLVNLANVMGYESILWDGGYDVVKNGTDTVLQANTGVCNGLSIRFTNWTFVFGDILWGEALRTQKTIIEVNRGQLDNSKNTQPSEQSVDWSREFTTSVDKYDLNTFEWNIGGGVSTTSEASSGFYSQSITFSIDFSIGESKQTGTVSASGESRTLSNSASTTVQPRSIQKYLVKVFGIQTNFDTSVVQLEARFSVEFSGPLRPDNFHYQYKGSDTYPNISSTIGSTAEPFYKALSDDIQKPTGNSWDWDGLMDSHPEAYEWVKTLTDRRTYSTSQYFILEAIQGTEVEIEFLSGSE